MGLYANIERDHERLADIYHERFGEPLVADAEWCQPYIDAARVAVEVDPALDPGMALEDKTDYEAEAFARAAAAIYVLTHGEAALRGVFSR